ncbi:tRNA (cytidine(34)-2'-O)-methyltransferase [bacterium]|nr:tRNA (cytidine(34)-2'-O)-methyltransferase [bacterium]
MPSEIDPLNLEIVLWEPEIPQNTGNIARTCACTGCKLHLAGPLGFRMRSPHVKRAGLDYWKFVEWKRWVSIDELWRAHPSVQFPIELDEWASRARTRTAWFFSTQGELMPWDVPVHKGDFLVFGPETRGLSSEILESAGKQVVGFPQIPETRSLNVSNVVAAAIYLIYSRWQAKYV